MAAILGRGATSSWQLRMVNWYKALMDLLRYVITLLAT